MTCVFAGDVEIDPAGRAGNRPNGWFVPTKGFGAEMVDRGGVDDASCAVLSATDSEGAAPFGNLMRSIDATPFAGKFVRLRAAIRHDGDAERVQMWVRVDRDSGKGFFDNMGDRPIRSDAWDHYEIIGDVADDARNIAVGFMLFGGGEAWIDDVTIEALDEVPGFFMDPPRQLSKRELDNVVAWTELLGYVRHFHPSDEAALADWDALGVHGMRVVESAKNARDLAERLTTLIAPVAPTVVVVPTSAAADVAPPTALPEHDVLAWTHVGFGQDNGRPSAYSRERVRGLADAGFIARLRGENPADSLPSPVEPHRVDLAGDITAFVPLAVYVEGETTLPRPTVAPTHVAPPRYTGNDRATRLAGVALAWGIFEHFYPYFDVVEVDWSAELRTALARAAEDADEESLLRTLQRLVATLQDGHGYVGHTSESRVAAMPLLWTWVDGELVVERAGESFMDAEPGDVLVAIDGVAAGDWIAEARQLKSAATEQNMRYVLAQEIRRGVPGTAARLRLRGSNGRVRTVEVPYGTDAWYLADHRPDPIDEIEPGVIYVDINRVDTKQFVDALPSMQAAERLIFDFRGYPGGLDSHVFFGHLIDELRTSPQWHTPVVRRPDEPMEYERGGEWLLQPMDPYLDAERVFITDGRAISYAESCMGIVAHYELGAIVGEATAGTNGNINPFTLPGGYSITWTGMKVLKHDGSQHHGVGIPPIHPVERTVQGIREGRDEFLEAALALEFD